MSRVVYAAAYRRQHGSFIALESYLDDAVNEALSALEPYTKDDARAALSTLGKLKPVSGSTPATLSLEARAYHLLEDYGKAEAAYGAWLNVAPPADEARKTMIAAMLRARKREPLWKKRVVGETFRDCPECPLMVVVPAGDFMMGAPESEDGRDSDEGPVHRVSVRQPFAIGKYEITFDEWDACVAGGGCNGYRPDDEGWGRSNRPVINVSYKDAKEYTAWLSNKTGRLYHLPSEAEWEYAAHAGTTTRHHFGNKIRSFQAKYNSPGGADPVGGYPSNAFGLHDVHGNVWEWTEDCWNVSYARAPSNTNVWKSGDCRRRVIRGGSWYEFDADSVRSANRGKGAISVRGNNFGFRIARTL